MLGLVASTTTEHHRLNQALERARSTVPTAALAQVSATGAETVETYLATASRHLGATLQALLPLALRRLPSGSARATELVGACRRCEEALVCVSTKLHHPDRTAHDPWFRVWHEVEAAFGLLRETELRLVKELARRSPSEESAWAAALSEARQSSPSRPHPRIPHRGLAGRTARAVARTVDHLLVRGSTPPEAPLVALPYPPSTDTVPRPERSLGSHGTAPVHVMRWAPEPRRVRHPDTGHS